MTQAVWFKNGGGNVDYQGGVFYQSHESILVGRRGNGLPAPKPENKVSSVIVAPREEHSKKPEKVPTSFSKPCTQSSKTISVSCSPKYTGRLVKLGERGWRC